MWLSAGFLRLGSVILRLEVMVPGMDVSKEDLVKMVYRRYRGQAYSCSDLVQSYIDGSKPSSGGANSKAANHRCLQSEMSSLHVAALEHFRFRVDQEKNAYLAIPTPLFEKVQGASLNSALASSSVPSTLPSAPVRGMMALSQGEERLSLQGAVGADGDGSSFADVCIGRPSSDGSLPTGRACAGARLLPGPSGAADGNQQGQDMTVFRVVRTQPNRLKRLAASCAACEPGISMIMTATIIYLFGRPLKDTDDVRQSDIALCPYQIEEVRGLQPSAVAGVGESRIRVARSDRPMISASSLFDASTDVKSMCRHMVKYLPAEAHIECRLVDVEERDVVAAMVAAGSFSSSGSYFHNSEDDVDTWASLQQWLDVLADH